MYLVARYVHRVFTPRSIDHLATLPLNVSMSFSEGNSVPYDTNLDLSTKPKNPTVVGIPPISNLLLLQYNVKAEDDS